MTHKRILIVDDEEAILTVLKNSLRKLDDKKYEVITAGDGFTALSQLEQQRFDLVVTDYNMIEMDGLELIETIRYLQPETRILMITAYGHEAIEAEARRLQVHGFLTKPLEINEFRRVVQEALGEPAPRRTGVLVLSPERHKQVSHLLAQLQKDVSARCTFLTNAEGRPLAKTGQLDRLPLVELASLLSGGLASLNEVGRTLDLNGEAINLAYHEGRREHLYAINIDHHFLLILIIDRGPYSSRLGSVWYYARQVALLLRDILSEAEYDQPPLLFQGMIEQAFTTELDKLLSR